MFDILDGIQPVPGGQIRTGQDGTFINSVPLVCCYLCIKYSHYFNFDLAQIPGIASMGVQREAPPLVVPIGAGSIPGISDRIASVQRAEDEKPDLRLHEYGGRYSVLSYKYIMTVQVLNFKIISQA